MRYSKTHVNEIIDQVVEAAIKEELGVEFGDFPKNLELIREEHLLIDRRKSSIPEYQTDIIHDFMTLKFSYKELMKKYHCSMRTVRTLLMECGEDDPRIWAEIEYRRH